MGGTLIGISFAIRPMVKLPTGDQDIGTSTGKADGLFDVIVSKELARTAEVAGYVGYSVHGSPDGFDVPNDRQVILDSLGSPAAYCLFPADRPLTHDELLACVKTL